MPGRLRYDPHHDYYVLLGVSATASTGEIRRAYHRRAKELHPDRNPSQPERAKEAFQMINEAYEVLGDPDRRRQYDRLRWPYVSQPAARPPTARQDFYSTPTGGSRPQHWPRHAPRSQTPPFGSPWPWGGLLALLRGPFGSLYLVLVATCLMLPVSYLTIQEMTRRVITSVTPTAPPTAAVQIVPLPERPTPTFPPPDCTDPAMTITDPLEGQEVPPVFTITGSASPSDFWEYRVELAYLGDQADPADARRTWTLLGAPSREVVTDGPLVEQVNLNFLEPGYYLIRLSVQQTDGGFLPPCERLVVYRRGTR